MKRVLVAVLICLTSMSLFLAPMNAFAFSSLMTDSRSERSNAFPALSLTVWTDKEDYARQEVAIITTRTLFEETPIADVLVTIQVNFPNGTLWFLWTNATDADGYARFRFLLETWLSTGTYAIYASAYKPGLGNASSTTMLDILKEVPSINNVTVTPEVVYEPTTVIVKANVTGFENSIDVSVQCIVNIPNGTARKFSMIFDGTFFVLEYPCNLTDPVGTYEMIIVAKNSFGVSSEPFNTAFENAILASQGSMNIEVFDNNSLPIPRASLVLRRLDSFLFFDGSTDENGSGSFSRVPSGNYILDVSAEGYAKNSTAVEIVQGQATNVILKLAHLPLIQGSVRRTNGTPIPDAALEVFDSHNSIAVNTTDLNGAYMITVPEEGKLTLRASAVGFASNSSSIEAQYDTLISADFVLYDNGAAQGIITDGFSGQPIAKARVFLGTGIYQGIQTTTNDSGGFFFSDILPGEYVISAIAQGYLANATRVNISSGETELIELALGPTGNVSGYVEDALTKSPIKDAQLTLLDSNGVVFAEQVTDANGMYAFSLIRPASYSLIAFVDGYNSTNTNVMVNPYQTTTADFSLIPNNVFLSLHFDSQIYSRGETIQFRIVATNTLNESIANQITDIGLYLFGPKDEILQIPLTMSGDGFDGEYIVLPNQTLGLWPVMANATDSLGNCMMTVKYFIVADAFYVQFATDKRSYVQTDNAEFTLSVAHYSNLTNLLGDADISANVTILDVSNNTIAQFPLIANATNGTFENSISLANFEIGNYTSYVSIDDHKGNVATEKLNFAVAPDFSFSISSDESFFNRTQTVLISGYARYFNNDPVTMASINMIFEVKGYARSFSAITDKNGYFQYEFKPLGFDAGNYAVKAICIADGIEKEAQLTFVLLGLVADCENPSMEIPLNSTRAFLLNIGNIGENVLTSLDITVVPLDESITTEVVGNTPSNLAPGSWEQITIRTSANTKAPGITGFTVSVRTSEDALEQIAVSVRLVPAEPIAMVYPQIIEASINPGSNLMYQINITNIGYAEMTGVQVTQPSLDWISTDVEANGRVAPGESMLFDIFITPPQNLTLGTYEDEIVISADSVDPTSIYIVITITSKERGGLVFLVCDDFNNELSGASVQLQYQDIYTDILMEETDATGQVLFDNLMIGRYNYIVSKDGYEQGSGSVTVFPGTPDEIRITLFMDVLDVSFEVEPTQIQDQYTINLNLTFQTEIPPPVLLPIPPFIHYYADRAQVFDYGLSTMQEFTILNTGLISVSDIALEVEMPPNASGYHLSFLDLGEVLTIDSIEAKGLATIPVSLAVDPGILIDELPEGYVGSIEIKGTFIYFDRGSDIPKTAVTYAEVAVYIHDVGQRHLTVSPPIIFCFEVNGVLVIQPGTWPDRLPDVSITNSAQIEVVDLVTIAVGGGITLSLGFEIDIAKIIALYFLDKGGIPGELEQLAHPIQLAFFFAFGEITKTGGIPGEPKPIDTGIDWLATVELGGGPLYSLLFHALGQYLTGKQTWTIALAPSESAILQSESWSFDPTEYTSPAKAFAQLLSDLFNVKLKLGLDISEGAILYFYKWRLSENYEVGIVPIVTIEAYAPKIVIPIPRFPGGLGLPPFPRLPGLPPWSPPRISKPERPIVRRVVPIVKNGIHETVKLYISQQATLERDAFLATLTMRNKLATTPIENVETELIMTYDNGTDAHSNFFVTSPSLHNIESINGTGKIEPASTAAVRWTIIPKPGAGGVTDDGIVYVVQAIISYTVNGTGYNLATIKESITVKPQPLLTLDYYVPSEVKAGIPFKLAVKVHNIGAGTAHNLRIDSAQPIIYENIGKLMINFTIIGSGIRGRSAGNSLKIDFGDIAPGESIVGYWLIVCSLDGEFLNFTASFTHANELGGEDTSLILSPINTHIVMREAMKDDVNFVFLVDNNGDGTPDEVIDFIFDQGIPVVEVEYLVQYTEGSMIVQTEKFEGKWIWVDLEDPYTNQRPIVKVTRSDGKTINPMNYWMANGRIYLVDDPEQNYTIFFANPLLEIKLISPQNRTYYSNEIPLTFELNWTHSWIGYSLDDQTNITVTQNTTILVAAGTHHIIMYANDTIGNTCSSETVYFVVSEKTLVSCDSDGKIRFSFEANQAIYVKGEGYAPSTTYSIYLVSDENWTEGMVIPQRISGTQSNVTSNSLGQVQPTVLWNAPLKPGKYDIILDVDENGIYNPNVDAIVDNNVKVTAGVLVIPEFWQGALLGLTGCLAGFGLFYMVRRKRGLKTR